MRVSIKHAPASNPPEPVPKAAATGGLSVLGQLCEVLPCSRAEAL